MIRADVDRVVTAALGQLGVSESPAHSNRTPYGRWYGLDGNPWCAMFVSWVFDRAGYPLPAIRTARGFAYCPDLLNWATRNGSWRRVGSYRPRRGDIVLFSFGGVRADHVGIVQGVLADGRVHTVEGNTNAGGSRTGGSVQEHYRRSGIIGYVEVANVSSGPSSATIKFTQAMLNIVRSYTGRPAIKVDGIWGPETRGAVTEFQVRHNSVPGVPRIAVTNALDPQTLATIGWWVRRVLGVVA